MGRAAAAATRPKGPRPAFTGFWADETESPPGRSPLLAELEHRQESLLGDLDPAHLLHPLLTLLLRLEQLALARDVAAVTLGEQGLAVGFDRLRGHDPRADRRLDRHVVLLARDLLAELLSQRPAGLLGLGAVHEHRQGVDRVPGQQDVELDQI